MSIPSSKFVVRLPAEVMIWNAFPLLARSLWMRGRARRAGLPGLEMDGYGRVLALREAADGRWFSRRMGHALLNPVSCVRYFEFDFAARALLSNADANCRILDISSPRLFPFWVAEKQDLHVTMVNPDLADMAETHRTACYVKASAGLEFVENVDATRLPFADDSFDAAISISVIEHVGDAKSDGDTRMVDELIRVVQPGGRIILTFPVKPLFENEFRDEDYYGTQTAAGETRTRYFFQRFYDEGAIEVRLLGRSGASEEQRRYFVEDPPGWFGDYEREWMRSGLAHTVDDPWLMARHFRDAGTAHPSDRLGVCGLSLVVDKSKGLVRD